MAQDSDVETLPADIPWKDVPSSGYVKDTYQCAVWAIKNTYSFEDALVYTVNRRDDADTTGAVAGQMAGAIYGLSAIPERWVNKILWKDQILDQAEALYKNGVTTSNPAVQLKQ